MKRQRATTKQRQGSLLSAEYDNEEEAELMAVFNSDKSCRQLFTEKKRESCARKSTNVNTRPLSSSTTKSQMLLQQKQLGTVGFSSMALVAEADHEAEEAEDENNNTLKK